MQHFLGSFESGCNRYWMLSHRNILNALLCTTKTICSLIGVNRPSAFVGASESSLSIGVLDTSSFLINRSLSVWENRLTSLTGLYWQMYAHHQWRLLLLLFALRSWRGGSPGLLTSPFGGPFVMLRGIIKNLRQIWKDFQHRFGVCQNKNQKGIKREINGCLWNNFKPDT